MAPKPTSPSGSQYADYTNYVAQVVYANAVGSTGQIPNELATAGLNTAILIDPVKIRAFRSSVADQMNAQSGGPRFEDLTDRIADIRVETIAQGASTLEVDVIDPMWALETSGFLQSDASGYLWPLIEVNIPTGTDAWWRVCQWKGTKAPDQPHTLMFEDRIVSILREISPANGGLASGTPNQTLTGFFRMLVDSANSILKPKPPIRFVPLVSPQDPNYLPQVQQVPASYSTLRPNPNKNKTGLTAAQQQQLRSVINIFGGVSSTTIAGYEALSAGKLAQLTAQPVFSDPGVYASEAGG
jgi:hypothetical protein